MTSAELLHLHLHLRSFLASLVRDLVHLLHFFWLSYVKILDACCLCGGFLRYRTLASSTLLVAFLAEDLSHLSHFMWLSQVEVEWLSSIVALLEGLHKKFYCKPIVLEPAL